MDERPTPPAGLLARLLNWLMRRQAGTRPCMSWPADEAQKSEAEAAALDFAERH